MNSNYLVAALASERQQRMLREAEEFRRAQLARSGKARPTRSQVARKASSLVALVRGDLATQQVTNRR